MSAPLVYSSHSKKVHTKPSMAIPDDGVHFPPQGSTLFSFLVFVFCFMYKLIKLVCAEKKMEGMTRDVGTQSTPPDLSSSSPSPASTPIIERSLKICEGGGHSPNSNGKLKAEGKV
ncbi:hypothetical protein P3X46_029548 [Hevea brasiliensis]|nr:hypothetical protein P3X46_029548 [Hevea brasiliensis]